MVLNFTAEAYDVHRYNGKEDSKIYIAVRRTVYDVSSGASFYGINKFACNCDNYLFYLDA